MTIIDILVISGVGLSALLILFFYINSTLKIKKKMQKEAELASQKEKDKLEAESKNAEKEKKEKAEKEKETKVTVEVVNPETGHKTETNAVVLPAIKTNKEEENYVSHIQEGQPFQFSEVIEKAKTKDNSLESKDDDIPLDEQIDNLSPELKTILFTDIIKPRF